MASNPSTGQGKGRLTCLDPFRQTADASLCRYVGYMLQNTVVSHYNELFPVSTYRKDCWGIATQYPFVKEVRSLQLCFYSGEKPSGSSHFATLLGSISSKWCDYSHIFSVLTNASVIEEKCSLEDSL